MFGRLQNAHSVAFAIEKACIQTNARNIHRFPEHLPSRLSYLFQCLLNIRYCNDNRRMLAKWVLGFFVETTVDHSGIFRSAFFVGFGRGHDNILSHFGTEHLRLPTESFGIESGHPILVFIGHFKMYDWVRIFPSFPEEGTAPSISIIIARSSYKRSCSVPEQTGRRSSSSPVFWSSPGDATGSRSRPSMTISIAAPL